MEFFEINVDDLTTAISNDCTSRNVIFFAHKCNRICGGNDVVQPTNLKPTALNELKAGTKELKVGTVKRQIK